MDHTPRKPCPHKIRYVVAIFSFLLVVINGCDAVYFNTEDNLQRLHEGQKEIRVLTLRHPLIFQKDSRGQAYGIDYDLLTDFAKHYGLKLNFIERKNEKDLFDSLSRGEGDLIAARISGEDAAVKGFISGPAYEETHLSLFCNSKHKVSKIQDLSNKSVVILAKESDSLLEKRLQLLAPEIKLSVLDNSTAKKMLSRTAKNQHDCALAEDLEGTYFSRSHVNLYKVGAMTKSYSLHWILRPEHHDLQTLMQQWFQHASRHDDVMRIQDRYRTFIDSLDVQDIRHFTRHIQSTLPTYVNSFKAAARHYQIDWKLLGSIAFQESHWNANAVSYTGVKGLMQLTLSTAALAGVEDRTNPHQSIWGGAYYFKYLWNRFPSHIHYKDRMALSLAAYNMGYGHLLDAQKLVLQQGRNPFSWRDVKAVLPLLSDPDYTADLDYGPARGYETLEFVERVRGYYTLWNTLEG